MFAIPPLPKAPAPRTGPGTKALNCCLRGKQLNAQGCVSRGRLKSAYAFCACGGIQALPTLSHGGSHTNNKSMDHLLPGDGRRGALSLGHQLWGRVSLQNGGEHRWDPFREGAHPVPRALGILGGNWPTWKAVPAPHSSRKPWGLPICGLFCSREEGEVAETAPPCLAVSLSLCPGMLFSSVLTTATSLAGAGLLSPALWVTRAFLAPTPTWALAGAGAGPQSMQSQRFLSRVPWRFLLPPREASCSGRDESPLLVVERTTDRAPFHKGSSKAARARGLVSLLLLRLEQPRGSWYTHSPAGRARGACAWSRVGTVFSSFALRWLLPGN